MQHSSCFSSSELNSKLWVTRCDSPAWPSVFAPDFNESQSGGSGAYRGNIRVDYSLLSSSFIKRNISGSVVCCIWKYGGGSVVTGLKVKKKTCHAAAAQPDTVALMWKHVKYRCVSLRPRGAVSIIPFTWLPLAWGGEQAHQGHCLWLILKSMKAAFSRRAIHLCFCFLCLQRFVLHIRPDR